MLSFLKEKLSAGISGLVKKLGKELGAEKRAKPKKAKPKKAKPGLLVRAKEILTTKTIDEAKFDELFWELELALMQANVALAVIDRLRASLKGAVVGKRLPKGRIEEIISASLAKAVAAALPEKADLVAELKRLAARKRPVVFCFFGVNGSGKTTTIAKLAKLLKSRGFSCVLAAADTFRAAAIEQLKLHGEALGIKVIAHDYGADAAAVAYDAIAHAKAHNLAVVLIDTAGRSHANINLMDELKKIVRVAAPDLKIFVGDALTGNDMIEQAESYNSEIGIDGVILAKADVDEKGGAILSVATAIGKPIYYLGVGQRYTDLEPFDKAKFMARLAL